MLLTMPRMLGYVFNPVSFYFCFDTKGEPFAALAEVSNTFREMKLYLITQRDEEGVFRLVETKHFYVSPFSTLDIAFDFKLHIPGETLEIHIDDRDGSNLTLLSAITGKTGCPDILQSRTADTAPPARHFQGDLSDSLECAETLDQTHPMVC